MYEFIAIDIDDTLLNSKLKIPNQNKIAIEEAVKKGVKVTLATGRMFCSALLYAKELDLSLPLITYHGALIKDADKKKTIYHQPVPLEISKQIAKYCQNNDLHLNVYIDDTLYVMEENEHTDYYVKIAQVPCRAVGDLVKFITRPPTKLTVVVHDQKAADDAAKEFDDMFGDYVEVTQSKKRFIEVINSKVSKGNAIKIIKDKYGISRGKTLAIGDSLNDISMLEYCNMGICVSNSRLEVKNKADAEVLSNDEAGVGEAIYRYVLGRDFLGGSYYATK